jgi:hypothetical protein
MLPTPLSARSRAVIVVLLAAGFGASMATAQQTSQPDALTKSVQELTGELRSLRVAVERSGEGQLQAQVLGLYVTLQQQRVAAANGRVDAVRGELEAAVRQSAEVTEKLAQLEGLMPLENDPERRRHLEGEYRQVKQLLDRLSAQENRIKNREAELNQAAQAEELQWRDLVSRIEQLLKK